MSEIRTLYPVFRRFCPDFRRNLWNPDILGIGRFSKTPKSGRPYFGHLLYIFRLLICTLPTFQLKLTWPKLMLKSRQKTAIHFKLEAEIPWGNLISTFSPLYSLRTGMSVSRNWNLVFWLTPTGTTGTRRTIAVKTRFVLPTVGFWQLDYCACEQNT